MSFERLARFRAARIVIDRHGHGATLRSAHSSARRADQRRELCRVRRFSIASISACLMRPISEGPSNTSPV